MSQVFEMSSSRKCRRAVHSEKIELETNWWNRLIQVIEESTTNPNLYENTQLLKQIFPHKLLHEILHILNVVPKSDISIASTDWTFVPPSKLIKPPSLSTIISDNDRIRYNVGKINPYEKFFKRDPKRAAIWYPLPPISMDEMHLTQKADAITEKIAREFVDWMERIFHQDGVTQKNLTVAEIMKMFEIGFNSQAARTLCVRFEQIATIPDQVAYLKELPKFAKRHVLFRQIQRDFKASRQPRKLLAFGSILPADLQVHPPSWEKIKNQWFGCDRIYDELQSMATVFHDIMHLATTRGFCRYLLEHPDIPPPTYLKDSGILDLKNLEKLEEKIEDENDVGGDGEFESPAREAGSTEEEIEDDNMSGSQLEKENEEDGN